MTKQFRFVKTKYADGYKGVGYSVYIELRYLGVVWRHVPGIDCTDKDVWCWRGTNQVGTENYSIGGGRTRLIAAEKLADWVFTWDPQRSRV